MEDIKKIREKLPHGAQTEIAKIANVHFTLVNRVLNGKSTNTRVLNAIADYLIDKKKEENQIHTKFSSVIN